MGQYWKFVNVDKRRNLPGFDGPLAPHFYDNFLASLVDLLALPDLGPPPTLHEPAIARLQAQTPLSPLPSLPRELLDTITTLFTTSATPIELLNLALTSPLFFRLLLPAVHAVLKQDVAPWAGDRLVCCGDYAIESPASCTEADVPARADDSDSDSDSDSDGEERENPIYHLAGDVAYRRPLPGLLERFKAATGRSGEGAVLERILARESRGAGEGVLRCLDTREFVMGSVVGRERLGEVVCSQVLWTSDSTGVPCGLEGQGEWAGCRFDVVGAGEFDEGGWVDVSREALGWVQAAREK